MSRALERVPHLGTTALAYAERPRSHDRLLRAAARRWPDAVAVEAPSGALTYAALNTVVDAMAANLRAAGAAEDDVVAVALGHDLPLFAMPYAASRAGVTALLLNTGLQPSRWATQLDKTAPGLLVADDAHRNALAAAAGGRPVLPAADVLAATGPSWPHPPRDDETRPIILIATSGTTGVPKITQVTSRGLVHAALAYVDLLSLTATDRAYVCLPLHYIGPLSAQTTTMALLGGTCVLPDDTRPHGALPRMAAARITFVDAVPAWLALLVREPAVPVPTWRTLIYGGAPMPHEVAARLAARYPDLHLYDVWGLSETHGPATALRYDPHAPPLPGTVGRPVAGVEVRTDGPEAAPGELLVRGANVSPGYHDDPALTAQILDGGWLRTGDVGTVGPDGTVRILDRAKDVILRGGANVFSVEVEQVLGTDPAVAEAAVFGVPDGLGGEAVAAAIVLRPGAELDVVGLRRLVAEQVGSHAVPRRVAAVPRLPRNPTGKIDKNRLRKEQQ